MLWLRSVFSRPRVLFTDRHDYGSPDATLSSRRRTWGGAPPSNPDKSDRSSRRKGPDPPAAATRGSIDHELFHTEVSTFFHYGVKNLFESRPFQKKTLVFAVIELIIFIRWRYLQIWLQRTNSLWENPTRRDG
jgi:hypothetical protein